MAHGSGLMDGVWWAALWVALLAMPMAAAAAKDEAPADVPAPAADAPVDEADELDAIIAEILAGPAADGEEDVTANCLARSRIRRTEVLSERHVAFHMRGGEKYLVQFRRRCSGLRRNRPIRLEARSFQLCSMDSIQGSWDFGGYGGSWGPRCLIPNFVPVSAEQLEFIEEALQAGDVR